MKLYIDEKSPTGHSLVNPISGRSIEVQSDTLDNMVLELGIEKVDFLKMDIEGAEVETLEGAKRILKTAHKVVVETHHRNGKPTWPEVQEFLKNRRYVRPHFE